MKSKTLVERQLEILNSENKNLTKTNTKLLSDISKKNIKIDDLTILVNNTIASVNKLTNEVSTLRQECALLNFKCNNYEKQIATLKSDLSQADATITKLHDENIVLRKENSDLKAQIVILKNDNDRMKKIINNDSNNSSNPPSSDIKKNIPNNRSKSKNSIGGQKGHKPHFLSKKDIEDKIKDNKFNHNVVNVGKISDTYVSKYIVDISVSVNATEYRFFMDKNGKFNIPKEFKNDVQYGNELKTLCAVLNTEGIVAIDRLNGFVSSITHGKINMSNGTIVNFINSLAKKSSDVIADLKNNLLNSNLMYTDATTARCSNRTIFVRNYSTLNILYLRLH
ncbi:MAG: DUF6444 domain-containing protein [Clostridia bacterium]